jgi:hypothetical protein
MPLACTTLIFNPKGLATCVLLVLATWAFDPEGLASATCVLLVCSTLPLLAMLLAYCSFFYLQRSTGSLFSRLLSYSFGFLSLCLSFLSLFCLIFCSCNLEVFKSYNLSSPKYL